MIAIRKPRPFYGFFKFCKDCGNKFKPKGRYFKYCDKCQEKRKQLRSEKIRRINGK